LAFFSRLVKPARKAAIKPHQAAAGSTRR
jgi:hypothetical protein